MIYLDSAAVIKLIRSEPHSDDLFDWLDEQPDSRLVSSALVEVEVPRALRRHAPRMLAAAAPVLTRLFRYGIDDSVRATAGAFTETHLRSLDAIHLATALFLAADPEHSFRAFVTYDKRLLAAAADNGLPVASPGPG